MRLAVESSLVSSRDLHRHIGAYFCPPLLIANLGRSCHRATTAMSRPPFTIPPGTILGAYLVISRLGSRQIPQMERNTPDLSYMHCQATYGFAVLRSRAQRPANPGIHDALVLQASSFLRSHTYIDESSFIYHQVFLFLLPIFHPTNTLHTAYHKARIKAHTICYLDCYTRLCISC